MRCIMKVSLPVLTLQKRATDNTTGEGHFDESAKPSGTATPIPLATEDQPAGKRKKGMSKKAKTAKQRLAVADGQV
jgi:hypothetical protein